MGIFRLAPDNSLHLLDTMTAPNGIGVSPDGTKLYSSDQMTGWVMWDLDKQGNASNRRNFVARNVVMGGDSLKIDAGRQHVGGNPRRGHCVHAGRRADRLYQYRPGRIQLRTRRGRLPLSGLVDQSAEGQGQGQKAAVQTT
jgi:sugar lactone lactonase YvrE